MKGGYLTDDKKKDLKSKKRKSGTLSRSLSSSLSKSLSKSSSKKSSMRESKKKDTKRLIKRLKKKQTLGKGYKRNKKTRKRLIHTRRVQCKWYNKWINQRRGKRI